MAGRGLVGRDGELAELSRALDEMLAGLTRFVLIAGEPGIGKTTLADALSSEARARDVRVVWGRAAEAGGAPAFWPWVQVLRAVLGPDTTAAMDPRTSVVARLFPEARTGAVVDAPSTLPSEAARFELFDAVAQQLVRSARWSPLVIVLDDMHAADVPSLQLLHFCSRDIRDVPLLFVATYRDAEVRSAPELSELVGRIARESRTISLHGLSEADVASYLRADLGDDADRVASSVHQLTDGNPLFVREVANLIAQGRIDLDHVGSALSEGVRETIRQRLRPLPDADRALIAVAAVAGVDFSVATAASACGRTVAEALEGLDRAAALGLVQRDTDAVGRYRFAHALVRDAVYENLSSADRASTHLRLADVIERDHRSHIDAHLAELAHHVYEAGAAAPATKSIEYARRAGKQALHLYAYEEAATHFERALDRATDEASRCDLLLDLSEARWKAGEQERSREAFAEASKLARRLGDPCLVARAALGYGGGGYTGRVDATLLGLLEEALAVVEDDQPAVRAKLLARLSLELYYDDLERARQLTAEAVELVGRTDDPATRAYVLNARRNAIWGPDDLDGRIAIATEVAKLGERHNIGEYAMEGHAWRLLGLAERGDVEAMDREIEALESIATALRQPFYLWELDLNRSARALAAGRLEEAEQLVARAAERGTVAYVADATLAYGVQLFFLRDLQGRLAELEGSLDAFYEAFPQLTALRAGIAYTLADLGRIDRARAELDDLRERRFELPRDRHWMIGTALLAAAAVRARDAVSAPLLYELLAPYEDRIVATTAVFSFGAVAHHLGLLADLMGRTGEAIVHLEAALERHIATRNRPWQARTSYELGRILAREGDEPRARDLLRSALEGAGELGMTAALENARAEYACVAQTSLALASAAVADSGEAAILFTDLVASTELLERLGDVRTHEVLSDHHRIVRKQLVELGGEETRFQGDGFMVVFANVRAAVSCAVAIQTKIAAYSREHPDTALHVRTGIHYGVPIIEDGELHGRSVVMASRIAGFANGGEVLVSSRVHDLVDDDVLCGTPRTTALKGFDGTFTLYPVLWG